VIPGAHHYITEDAPDTVMALVDTFVQANP